MKRIHLMIHGRVQGVFFRHNTKKQAIKLGLVGFVRNTEDGCVEAVAQGKDEDVDKLVEFCRKGPMLARVDDIEVKEEKPKKEFSDFEIRY